MMTEKKIKALIEILQTHRQALTFSPRRRNTTADEQQLQTSLKRHSSKAL